MHKGHAHPLHGNLFPSQVGKKPLSSQKHQPKSILKSQMEKQNLDDLLIFGYASKLYPPDQKSTAISKNKHLILWNEDRTINLLIDRYDCRASLHDLSEFDAESWNKSYQLSEEEIRLEERLDEERYRAMKLDELEENIRQEEEMKRLHASISSGHNQGGYQQVQHYYNPNQYDPSVPTADEDEEEEEENENAAEEEKPFIAPGSLAIPSEMEIPPTEKMHAIIEKTAAFISGQGVQMEIVLKAKQSKNSQFQFLQFGHYLNPYYKHMVKRIKEGKYTPGVQQNKEENEEESDESSDGEGYLHPSLFAASHKKSAMENEEKTKAIRKIDPSHPLAKLIEKGRAVNAAKQYQKMTETVYSYYQQTPSNGGNNSNTSCNKIVPPPLPPFSTMTSQFPSEVVATMKPPIYYDDSFVSSATPPPPGEEPVVVSKSTANTRVPTTALPTALPTAANWLTPQHQHHPHMVPPSPDLQPIVEEVARKVALEGEQAEMVFAGQDNPNYAFLRPWHELHPYYKFRKLTWARAYHPPPPPVTVTSTFALTTTSDKQAEVTSVTPQKASLVEDVANSEVSSNNCNKQSAPISFSIKPRKESTNKPLTGVSRASKILAEPASDDDIPFATNEENSTPVPPVAKRKFTETPETITGETLPQAEQSDGKLRFVEENQTNTLEVSLVTEEPLVSIPFTESPPDNLESIPQTATSNFAAVTPTGEVSSVSILREKQAARRLKAMQFLKFKQNQPPSKAEDVTRSNAEKREVINPANEDIFDLSCSSGAPEDMIDPKPFGEERTQDTTPSIDASMESSISKLEILQKIAGRTSRSSTPLSSSSQKRSRSRSRDRSRSKDPTRQGNTSSFSKLHPRDSYVRRSPSPSQPNEDLPSAYRHTPPRNTSNIVKRDPDRSTRKVLQKRSVSDRTRMTSPNRSSKHRRRRSSVSTEKQRKNKKRKKEKKIRKRNKNSKSRSSSAEEREDGQVSDDDTSDEGEKELRTRDTVPYSVPPYDAPTRLSNQGSDYMIWKDASGLTADPSQLITERSDGEIESD